MNLKNLLQRFDAWNAERRLQRNQKLFMELYKDPKSGIQELVKASGYRVGMGIAMGVLDELRIQHCVFCPTVAPLIRHEMGFMCQSHIEAVKRKPTKPEEVLNNAKV